MTVKTKKQKLAMRGITNTFPVPNWIHDDFLRDLKIAELKILLVIIRHTYGWKDDNAEYGRKVRDWFSRSQLKAKTKCSIRAISNAIESLVQKELIVVMDKKGCDLDTTSKRKGTYRLFYKLAATVIVIPPGNEKEAEKLWITRTTSAKKVEQLRKEVTELGQKKNITNSIQ